MRIEVCNIQFTSGTTGLPKGAALTHFNIVNNAFFCGEGMRLGAADRVCIPVPMYLGLGMVIGVLAAMTHGAASVFPGEGFEPLAVLETVAGERCTALLGVPTPCSSQSWSTRAFREFDLSVAAHRRHGRIALSDRGHGPRDRRDAHARGHDLPTA